MIAFNKYYNQFNILSISLVIISLLLLIFKGLNFGIDFKGGTLIELRSTDSKINVSSLRDNLNQMNLGDVSVKNFGNETDFLIKFENDDNKNVIEEIKNNLDKSFGNNFNFRRVENVGPKVSAELLKSGVIAITVALGLMLIYIWIRFEWQFSLGAILALFHDVIVTLGLFSLLGLEINLSIIKQIIEEKSQKLENLSTQLAKYLSPQIYRRIFSDTEGTSGTISRKNISVFFFIASVLNFFTLFHNSSYFLSSISLNFPINNNTSIIFSYIYSSFNSLFTR